MQGYSDSGFVAGCGVLVQGAFQNGAIQQAEGLFQAFLTDGDFTGQGFFHGGSDGGFQGHVTLAVALGNINTFFGGFNSRQDAIPS